MDPELCQKLVILENVLFFAYGFFLLCLLLGVREYHMSVVRSPAIPFDGSKKPTQGVLKPSPATSRINPFYKLNKKKKFNSQCLNEKW
jgi:hypothetical protein